MNPLFEEREVHLRDYLYILRKRRVVTLCFFLAVVLLGILFTCFETVLYRAAATILIERENPNVVDFKEVMALDASTTDFYQTQYQRLKSRSLIQELIQKENLAEDPYLKQLSQGRLRRFLRNQRWLPPWFQEFVAEPYLEDVLARRMLRVEPMRNSRLVEVSILHPDAARSAQLTNRLAELFIDQNLKDRFTISKRATELIGNQLTELKEKVEVAERKLQKYKEALGLVNIPSMHEKDDFFHDARLELVKVQSEESKLAKRYLPDHPKVIHIRSQIEGLKAKIAEEEKRILEQSRNAIDYSELEREAESTRQIYEALLKRLQETSSESRTQASNILIVDRAKAPLLPHRPKPFLNILMAVFLGASGGFLLAFFLEYLDSSVKIPEDIEHGLGLDLLGIIPQADKAQKGGMQGSLFFSAKEPTPTSEALRALRTALIIRMRHLTSAGGRAILVTSPNPEEGKSTVLFNLASAFEQNHLKVLVLDADLRKPGLHKILGCPAEKGLTEVLEGQHKAEDVIKVNIGGLGFDFLSCGTPSYHPTEILGSERMKQLVENLKRKYDIVLLDSPPYLAVADVIVLSECVDGVLVIARYHRTDKRHLKDVKRRFSHASAKFLGVVINRVKVHERDRYYQQYYYYGYGENVPRK